MPFGGVVVVVVEAVLWPRDVFGAECEGDLDDDEVEVRSVEDADLDCAKVRCAVGLGALCGCTVKRPAVICSLRASQKLMAEDLCGALYAATMERAVVAR